MCILECAAEAGGQCELRSNSTPVVTDLYSGGCGVASDRKRVDSCTLYQDSKQSTLQGKKLHKIQRLTYSMLISAVV